VRDIPDIPGKALRVTPRGKQRLTVYRAHQVLEHDGRHMTRRAFGVVRILVIYHMVPSELFTQTKPPHKITFFLALLGIHVFLYKTKWIVTIRVFTKIHSEKSHLIFAIRILLFDSASQFLIHLLHFVFYNCFWHFTFTLIYYMEMKRHIACPNSIFV